AEVKKGVMDLPEETKQSTTAMRRAVSEQINALKALADIVAKSGRAFDATERKPQPRRPAPPAPAPTLAPPPPLQPLQPPLADTPLRGSHDGGTAVQERTQPQAPQSPGGGWVKDLLRGAEREEARPEPARQPSAPERSPLHVVES